MVGTVIVQNGKIIAEGYHPKAGAPHAEIFALARAGKKATGASLYVNLEPCIHFGRTPPCVEAIIKAGIKEVHIATGDPNSRVNGKGKAKLEQHGITVIIGESEEEAKKLNEVFFKYITSGLPFVTVKFAMTLDGKIATKTGDSRWITGEKARHVVHHLRSQTDAILVGVNTVIKDDPQLTTRLPNGKGLNPIRIILDSQGRIPLTAKIVSGGLPGKTIVATTNSISSEKKTQLTQLDIEVIVLPQRDGRVDLAQLLKELTKQEVTSILVEGGGETLASFFHFNLVDKVYAFIASKIVGGDTAPTPVRGEGVEQMNDAIKLYHQSFRRIGDDVLITGYPDKGAK